MEFRWSLKNNGELTAEGYKCDTAYMSRDTVWDIRDQQVGSPVCGDINLEPFSTSSDTVDPRLEDDIPLLIPDNYYGLVRTRTNIKDPNLANNVGTTLTSQRVDLPMLTLGGLSSGFTISRGQSRAYVINDVPAAETLLVTLTSLSGSLFDMYVKFDEPATGFDFDGSSLLTDFDRQEVIVENTDEGSYYVLVTNNGPVHAEIDILPEIAQLEIRRVTPDVIGRSKRVTLLLEGTLFERNMVAKLTNQFQETTAVNYYFFSSTRVYAEFDTSSLIPGVQLSVYLESSIDSIVFTELTDAVRLIYGRRGSVTYSLDSIRSLVVQSVVPVQFNYVNSGKHSV